MIQPLIIRADKTQEITEKFKLLTQIQHREIGEMVNTLMFRHPDEKMVNLYGSYKIAQSDARNDSLVLRLVSHGGNEKLNGEDAASIAQRLIAMQLPKDKKLIVEVYACYVGKKTGSKYFTRKLYDVLKGAGYDVNSVAGPTEFYHLSDQAELVLKPDAVNEALEEVSGDYTEIKRDLKAKATDLCVRISAYICQSDVKVFRTIVQNVVAEVKRVNSSRGSDEKKTRIPSELEMLPNGAENMVIEWLSTWVGKSSTALSAFMYYAKKEAKALLQSKQEPNALKLIRELEGEMRRVSQAFWKKQSAALDTLPGNTTDKAYTTYSK